MNMSGRVFSKDITLDFYDTDCNNRLRLSAMLRHFAMLAGEDYTERGMGHAFLKQHGYAFLVTQSSFKIYEMPSLDYDVRISTWVEKISGAKFIRGYEMTTRDGRQLIIGEGVWICVNPESRKIVRPGDFPWMCEGIAYKDIPFRAKSIKTQTAEEIAKHRLQYSEIDLNGHLNNTVYGDIIMNALPLDEVARDIDTFTLHYSHEAKLGEELTLYRESLSDNECVILGKVDDRKCFESEIVFK